MNEYINWLARKAKLAQWFSTVGVGGGEFYTGVGERDQNTPLPNRPLWYKDYSKLETFKI